MARLPMPDLPEGNLRDLIAELHSLHARAGWPSVRDMARGQQFSYNAVHALFTSPDGEPRLPVLLAVVHRLATMDPRADPDQVLDKFDRLWQAARVTTVDADPSSKLVTPLTARERTVLALLVRGMSTSDVSQTLLLSEATCWRYIDRLCEKLLVSRRGDLVARAREWGLGDEDPL
jgi:DNA-binding NarL/FixJ family response regulator